MSFGSISARQIPVEWAWYDVLANKSPEKRSFLRFTLYFGRAIPYDLDANGTET
jgi:hypothetical protein